MKNSKQFLEVKKISKKFYNENKEAIIDIVIFGSAIKSKDKPADIDVTLITKVSREESSALADKFKEISDEKVHVTYNIIDDLFKESESIWLSLFFEGISLLTDKKLSESLGVEPKALFKYDSSKLSYNDKIKFYYALKGRGKSKGIVQRTNTEYLSKTVLLVDLDFDLEVQEFLKQWKLPYMRKILLIST